MSKVIDTAMKIAQLAHQDDLYGGLPYFVHPFGVAADKRVRTLGENAIAAAYLHDVIEDHPEFEIIVSTMMPTEIYHSVALLTHLSGKYMDYIKTIADSGDKIAITVKLADIAFNVANNPKKTLRKRYIKAKTILEKALSLIESDSHRM